VRRDLFDAEHEAFRQSIRVHLERTVLPEYRQWEADGIVPRTYFSNLGSIGLFAAIPEAYGGAGVRDIRFSMVFAEESARLGLAVPAAGATLHADVCLPYYLDLANDEQRQRWFAGLASGESIAAIAMTEPGAGSDLAGIATRATRDGDHFVVSGAKTFITNGINADLVIVVVRTGPERHNGLSLLVVERGTEGFERGANLDKIGMHGQDTAELFFDDARVPIENLLGEIGGGFRALTDHLPQERLSIALAAVAGAAAALEWTTEYVGNRRAFGASLASLQSTRMTLAEVATEIDVAQAFIDRCVDQLLHGTLTPIDAAKAKWWATDMQSRMVDRCVQLHGGYGFMSEQPIARAFVDARAARIYGGANEVMKEIIGRSLTTAGRDQARV
jgi:alkylation response protein AidB-like acyl-CoA dehydrogenase